MDLLKRSVILVFALSIGVALAGCQTGRDRNDTGTATGSSSGSSTGTAPSGGMGSSGGGKNY